MRADLIELARRGDDGAFERLVELDGDRCFAVAYRILRDRSLADDAVQQAFLQAWRELPKLRQPDRYEVWLHRLLVNACYGELRRMRRWRDRTAELPDADELSTSVDAFAAADARDALERAFARLSPDRRAAFVLHHYAGLPIAAVADALGLPEGTVKSRLHYSARTLRAALAADGRTGVVQA